MASSPLSVISHPTSPPAAPGAIPRMQAELDEKEQELQHMERAQEELTAKLAKVTQESALLQQQLELSKKDRRKQMQISRTLEEQVRLLHTVNADLTRRLDAFKHKEIGGVPRGQPSAGGSSKAGQPFPGNFAVQLPEDSDPGSDFLEDSEDQASKWVVM